MSPLRTPKVLREERKATAAVDLRRAREACVDADTGGTLSQGQCAEDAGISPTLWAQYENAERDAHLLVCDVPALKLKLRLAIIASMLPEGYAVAHVGSAETQMPRLSELLGASAKMAQEVIAACADGHVSRAESPSMKRAANELIDQCRTIVAICDVADREGVAKASVLS